MKFLDILEIEILSLTDKVVRRSFTKFIAKCKRINKVDVHDTSLQFLPRTEKSLMVCFMHHKVKNTTVHNSYFLVTLGKRPPFCKLFIFTVRPVSPLSCYGYRLFTGSCCRRHLFTRPLFIQLFEFSC